MKVNFVVGEHENSTTGVSRYRDAIYNHLKDKVDFNILGYPPNSFISPIRRLFLFARTIKKYENSEITHITSNQYAHVLNSLKNGRSIVTVHNIYDSYILNNSAFREEIKRTQGRICNWLFGVETKRWIKALKKATLVLADSDFSRHEIINRFHCEPSRVRTVLLGVDTDLFKPNPLYKKPPCFGDKTVLYIGSTTLKENSDTMERAFYILKEKMPEVRLVRVMGGLSGENLSLYYNAADVLIFPSIYEEFGLPPLEAMACGTPVVASNTSSMPEVVGDAGMLVDHTNFHDFASAMYEVLTDDGRREEMIKRGLERARWFTWEKTANETLKAYEEVGS